MLSYSHLSLKACLFLYPSIFLKVSGTEGIVLVSVVLCLKPPAVAPSTLGAKHSLFGAESYGTYSGVLHLLLGFLKFPFFLWYWNQLVTFHHHGVAALQLSLALFPRDSSCKCMVVIYHLPSPVFICKVWIFMLWLS